jgi:hypothetical protein
MNNIFLIAAVISLIFLIAKFIEMRYIDNEPKPFKVLLRDTLLVYVCVVCGFFIFNQLKPVIHEASVPNVPPAFTDNPPF